MRRLLEAAAAVVVAVICGCGGGGEAVPLSAPTPAPATPAAPAAPAAPAPPAAAAPRLRWTTARVLRRVQLRSSPDGPVVGVIGRRTEFGSPRVVSVAGRRGDWLRVIVAERPNGAPAWIAARAARLGGTNIWLTVDRSDRRVLVRDGNRVVRRFTVGVGRPGHETPTGRFAVTDKLYMGSLSATYGCCAIAFTAHQPNLPQGWSGLDRIAIHGARNPATIGSAASTGCLHATERELRRMMRTIPLGTPVFVRA
jgi:lipoprotein-anchoring transpeptidase ErfK/SrfK